MIAPFRPSREDSDCGFQEPRQIGDLLIEVLALRGIDLTPEQKPNRLNLSAGARRREIKASPATANQRVAS